MKEDVRELEVVKREYIKESKQVRSDRYTRYYYDTFNEKIKRPIFAKV